MNTATAPSLAERLQRVPNGTLLARLSTLRTQFFYAEKPESRARYMAEIDALKAECARRGLEVVA